MEAIEKAVDELVKALGAPDAFAQSRSHLLSLVREAVQDSERLDWLEALANRQAEAPRGDGNGTIGYDLSVWIRRQRGHEQWPTPFTVREAIDAARKEGR